MAVSKRTRFEVLRRDNYTCRYCRSTESELTVDHVTPVALGGTDDPANLVAACKDCNSGKSSTSPDEGTVAQVADDTVRWAAALAKAAEITEAKATQSRELAGWFVDTWEAYGGTLRNLPGDFDATVIQFHALGLSRDTIADAVVVAVSKYEVTSGGKWRYFCGICWNKVRELQRMAEEILAAEGDA